MMTTVLRPTVTQRGRTFMATDADTDADSDADGRRIR